MENLKILENLEEIKSIDKQKQLIDEKRPFSREIEDKIFQKLKLDWNYNSNAIEGNLLTYGETIAFLNFGLTAKGKPFKDHLDIKGHNEAIQFMLQLIKENRPISENDIFDLHKILLVEPYFTKTISLEGIEFQKEVKIGKYKTSPNHVKTVSGDIHYYTNPEEVPFEMSKLLDWYRKTEEENWHPVVVSAVFHHKFTAIHPFDDGNGRLARLLSNFILLKHQYPVIVIKNHNKNQYYAALNIADNGIFDDLIQLFVENISHSFSIYEKALSGENINEADDLDKEIELFTKEMQVQEIKAIDVEKDKDFLVDTYIKGFLEYLMPKLNKIGELFQDFYSDRFEKKHISTENITGAIKEAVYEIKTREIHTLYFDKALIGGFSLGIDIEVKLKNKKVEYAIFGYEIKKSSHGYDVIHRKDKIINKDIVYSENPKSAFEEITKYIVNYLMNEIKNHSK